MARPKMVKSGLVTKEFTVDPGNVTAVTGLDVTVSVAGLKKGYPCNVWAPSLEANLAICNAHCSANGTLKFRIVNPTAGAINPASQTMYVVQF